MQDRRDFERRIAEEMKRVRLEIHELMAKIQHAIHEPIQPSPGSPLNELNAKLNNKGRQLRALEKAQERLDSGRYGICENSGTLIPKTELLANPTLTVWKQKKSLGTGYRNPVYPPPSQDFGYPNDWAWEEEPE